jgi:hypothetical protein
MAERGLSVDHSTIARWVLRFARVLTGACADMSVDPLVRDELMKNTSVSTRWTYLSRACGKHFSTAFEAECHDNTFSFQTASASVLPVGVAALRWRQRVCSCQSGWLSSKSARKRPRQRQLWIVSGCPPYG